MSLVPSLLQAIVRVDGEALVMHAGDKPYVVSPTGQVELASKGLALEAVNGIVSQLLPAELQHALDEFGAVQYELPAALEFPGEQFTVVAARGGDDVWIEIRRRHVDEDYRIPEEMLPPRSSAPVEVDTTIPEGIMPAAAPVQAPPQRATPPAAAIAPPPAPVVAPLPAPVVAPPAPVAVQPPATSVRADAAPHLELVDEELSLPEAHQLWGHAGAPAHGAVEQDRGVEVNEPAPPLPAPVPAPTPAPIAAPPKVAAPPTVAPAPPKVAPAPPKVVMPPPVVAAPAPRMSAVPPPRPIETPAPPQPAVVLPIARNPIRPEPQLPSMGDPTMSGLDRLLRTSAARGASTLYLSSESRPSVRVDGELQMLDGEPVLTSRDVESLLLTLMPERSHEALRTGAATEWICDIEGVGRVRCMSFRDHCGPGGVFRLMPTRMVSIDQLGLPQAVQSLTIEPEGLVLVAGPRSSGKRTLLSAFVDAINRTRKDHVITIEREINIVHERGNSFISQREVRGNDDDMLAAARAALREDPDVLVIEDLRTGGLMNVALEAAASGHLVVGGFSAHTATGAIDRIIDLYAPEFRRQVQLALADSLRGVVVQVLLRKIGGGRVAAREVLLNTPAVSSVIAEGKTSQLPMAIEGGRRYGMMPLNDALVGLVQSGVVEAREAYRQTTDRGGLLAALKRQGVDTSFVEKLA
ncbi:MAG: Flp pilus assembly complex ATPase component TadA [Acidobacteriia bacterium]|nr:Flp pilus assembly complex ATPase component TadA [Terriglobia bacterium]